TMKKDETIIARNVAIKAAEAVNNVEEVTQKEINALASALAMDMLELEGKTSVVNPDPETPGGDDKPDDGDNKPGDTTLDYRNLKDGVYSINGEVVKIDKETYSMSNEAINHTIKLTVMDRKLYLTINLNCL